MLDEEVQKTDLEGFEFGERVFDVVGYEVGAAGAGGKGERFLEPGHAGGLGSRVDEDGWWGG